jgi:hypothetical protein
MWEVLPVSAEPRTDAGKRLLATMQDLGLTHAANGTVGTSIRAIEAQAGPLDSAWAAVEAALPDGWRIDELATWDGWDGGWRVVCGSPLPDDPGVEAFGPTPAAALRALALAVALANR